MNNFIFTQKNMFRSYLVLIVALNLIDCFLSEKVGRVFSMVTPLVSQTLFAVLRVKIQTNTAVR